MKVYIGIIIAVIIGGGLLFMSQRGSGDSAPQSLTFQTVQSDVKSGAQLIDVRTPAEYNAGHIEGAINLNVEDIQMGTMPSGAKDQKIYVYCHSGNRSGQATTALKSAGYSNIVDLGAMTHVEAIGGTVVQ